MLCPENLLQGVLWFLSAKFADFPVLIASGTFDVPLEFAPSVNINSLVLIPLEAHEWNIPNRLTAVSKPWAHQDRPLLWRKVSEAARVPPSDGARTG